MAAEGIARLVPDDLLTPFCTARGDLVSGFEDDEIAKRMDRGRRTLYERSENEAGPYQSPMEDRMMHFHEHIKRGLAGRV